MLDEFAYMGDSGREDFTKRVIDNVIAKLPDALEQGHGSTLDWFVEYVASLDLAGKYGRFDEVVKLCEDSGYSADYRFDGEEDDITPDTIAREIIAHAMGCMNEGYQPLSFIDEQVEAYHSEVAYQQKYGGNPEVII